MRIIKHGQTFIFECNVCGCKFEVGRKEKCIERGTSPFSTGPKTIYCHCPECDTKVPAVVTEIVMDGGFTRIESQEKQTP